MKEKSNLGIKNIEEVLSESIPQGHSILILGSTGLGKNTISIKYLIDGATNQGEPGLLASFYDDRESIFSDARYFGWHLKRLEKSNLVSILNATPGSSKWRSWNNNCRGFVDDILKKAEETESERIVIDGMDELSRLCRNYENFHEEIIRLTRKCRDNDCTLLMTAPSEIGIENLVDGIIQLEWRKTENENYEKFMRIKKMRRCKYTSKSVPFEVTDDGVMTIRKEEETPDLEENEIGKSDIREGQEEFLHSLMRHDLRNKAQVIMGYLELLKDEGTFTENGENLLRKAIKSTEECSELIDKIRILRKVGEGELEPTSLSPVIKNIISEVDGQATKKGIDIEFKGENHEVKAGPLLQDLFSNIINNSIKHSQGNKIRIKIKEQDEEVKVIVEDDGVGIPDEIKEKVFERGFKKGEAGGSGLGLYMVKRIIENYNGSIKIKDSELGGVRFELLFQKA